MSDFVARVKVFAVKAAKSLIQAGIVGAGVAVLTVLGNNVIPELALEFDLDPSATAQVTVLVLLARDALKARGS